MIRVLVDSLLIVMILVTLERVQLGRVSWEILTLTLCHSQFGNYQTVSRLF